MLPPPKNRRLLTGALPASVCLCCMPACLTACMRSCLPHSMSACLHFHKLPACLLGARLPTAPDRNSPGVFDSGYDTDATVVHPRRIIAARSETVERGERWARAAGVAEPESSDVELVERSPTEEYEVVLPVHEEAPRVLHAHARLVHKSKHAATDIRTCDPTHACTHFGIP